MVIKKIEVGAFGKLEKYTIDLQSGVQVIYGPNEFGKSTLMEFLKMMFYGKRGGERSNSEDKVLRRRYTPWSGTRMSGSVEFTHKGNLYKIQKEISPESPGKDVTLILNKSTGETIKLGKKEEAGEYIFGIDVKSFERSSYIKNTGKLDFENPQNAKDSLADKILSNLSDTGESETSKSLITKRLDEAIKDLQWSRGNGGKIFNTKSLISEIKQKIYDLKLFEDNRRELTDKLSEIVKLRGELTALQAKAENAGKYQKFLKINEIIKLLDCKEKYIDDLKILRPEAPSVLEKLAREREKAESCLVKVRELHNITKTINKDEAKITADEVAELNLRLQEKKNLEEKLKEINYLFKNQILKDETYFSSQNTNSPILAEDFYPSLSSALNEYKKAQDALERLREKRILLQNIAQTTEFELLSLKNGIEKSHADFKKKKLWVSVFEIINLFIFAVFLYAGIFMSVPALVTGYVLPFILLCGGGLYYFKKSKKNISLLTAHVRKLEAEHCENHESEINHNQVEISKILTCMSALESNVQKILSDNMKETEQKLLRTDKVISEMLSLKNSSSVQDYYEKYAKLQNISEIQSSYQKALSEFENIESDFIQNITKYYKVSNFAEAVSALKNFIFINSEIDILERKIHLELNSVGIQSDDREFLKKYAEGLSFKNENADISPPEFQKIKTRIEFLKSLNLEEKYIEIQKNIKAPPENAEKMSRAFAEQKNKLLDMEMYLESLKNAFLAIEESSDELRKNFNPRLNTRVSEIFSCLTGGKYNRLHVEKNYGILVNSDMAERSCESFSSGTVDQAYLSLRIAIAELISGENEIPLILDDVFMQYDDNRLDKALNFLKNHSLKKPNGCQVIIFTCHKHVADMAAGKNIPALCAPADAHKG